MCSDFCGDFHRIAAKCSSTIGQEWLWLSIALIVLSLLMQMLLLMAASTGELLDRFGAHFVLVQEITFFDPLPREAAGECGRR